MRSIPDSYAEATWRGVLPASDDGMIGISFNVAGSVERFKIPPD